MGEERPPKGSALEQPGPRRSERHEQGKAKQVGEAGEVAPLVVCGAQRASLAAERGIFTFLKEQDVFHFQGKPLLKGLFGVEKKNKSLDSGEPVLRMIINAIPANALQQTIEADMRTLPCFGQWSAISVDEEDRVVVWNELDMTSAFYVFRLEPAWYKFQALAKPISGQFASRWVPNLGAEESVYPAVAVMAMGVEVIMRTPATDSQEALFPPQAHGSRVGPNQRSSARWSCSAKRQAK